MSIRSIFGRLYISLLTPLFLSDSHNLARKWALSASIVRNRFRSLLCSFIAVRKTLNF